MDRRHAWAAVNGRSAFVIDKLSGVLIASFLATVTAIVGYLYITQVSQDHKIVVLESAVQRNEERSMNNRILSDEKFKNLRDLISTNALQIKTLVQDSQATREQISRIATILELRDTLRPAPDKRPIIGDTPQR